MSETEGSPAGVGVPYWPSQQDGGDGGGGGGSGHDPDPLSVSELPSPLVPFGDFLYGDCGEGDGGDGRRQQRRRTSSGDERAIEFEPTAFDHPVFIMFSSGTTGLPKCMVHGAGGALFVLLCFWLNLPVGGRGVLLRTF